MTPPNAAPTRADVLREFSTVHNQGGSGEFTVLNNDAVADEVLRLRAQRDAMIRRVEGLPEYRFEFRPLPGAVSRAAVLAALCAGGDDGR